MKFVDSCEVDVVAGNGGNGAVAFRREKFVPFGGPAGGDGGRGGDVVFVADEGLSTLMDLVSSRMLRAPSGEHGQGTDCYGKAGKDLIVRVPVGTQVYDRETGTLLFDIDHAGTRVVVAAGGKGGRGNIHFATPYDRAPRRSEPGEPGEERKLRLELKVMADVGLLGFPNVGKSTFIRACSRARPKVADYPFTTLTPHLGVVRIGDEASFVIADIPGLIPGASEGAGLGHRFLKHVERTRALLHLVTLDPGEGRDPLSDYDALQSELERFDPELAERPQLVAMSKADLPEVREAYEAVKDRFLTETNVELRLVSAATGEGVRELLVDLYKLATGKTSVHDWGTPPEAPPAEEPLEAEPSSAQAAEEPLPAANAPPSRAAGASAGAVKKRAAPQKVASKAKAFAKKKAAANKKAASSTKKGAASKKGASPKKAAAKKPTSPKKAAASKKPSKSKTPAASKKAPTPKRPAVSKKAGAKKAAASKKAGASTKPGATKSKRAARTPQRATTTKPPTRRVPATPTRRAPPRGSARGKAASSAQRRAKKP